MFVNRWLSKDSVGPSNIEQCFSGHAYSSYPLINLVTSSFVPLSYCVPLMVAVKELPIQMVDSNFDVEHLTV